MSVPAVGQSRQWAFAGAVALCAAAFVGCKGPNPAPPPPEAAVASRVVPSAVAGPLVASFDLPREERSRELSGLTWDAAARTLYAISDHIRHIVPLTPSERFDRWTLGEPIPLAVPEPWDGEGLALIEGGFVVANETGPHLYELDRKGAFRRELPIPAHYAMAVPNASFESLSVSPSGRYLFTGNERALTIDGPPPTVDKGSTVRFLRIDRTTGAGREVAYRTDPIFAQGDHGEIGVSDVAALSDTELLVVERAYVPIAGNQIRVYRIDTASAADVLAVPSLSLDSPVVAKTLVLDLVDVAGEDRRQGAGPHPLFANYEGIALGPKLPDGRRIVFLVSDDNGHVEQSARLLTLALAGLP
jgi:hypothetical protein